LRDQLIDVFAIARIGHRRELDLDQADPCGGFELVVGEAHRGLGGSGEPRASRRVVAEHLRCGAGRRLDLGDDRLPIERRRVGDHRVVLRDERRRIYP